MEDASNRRVSQAMRTSLLVQNALKSCDSTKPAVAEMRIDKEQHRQQAFSEMVPGQASRAMIYADALTAIICTPKSPKEEL